MIGVRMCVEHCVHVREPRSQRLFAEVRAGIDDDNSLVAALGSGRGLSPAQQH